MEGFVATPLGRDVALGAAALRAPVLAQGRPGVAALADPAAASGQSWQAATASATRWAAVATALGGIAAAVAKPRSSRASRAGRVRAKAVAVRAGPAATAESSGSVGLVLLSAGTGKRMGAGFPKQYIKLLGREIALRSLEAFLDADVHEIVVVCAEEYRHLFRDYVAQRGNVRPIIKFADGGAERQDSVNNGLGELTTEFVAVHDCARPLVTSDEINKVIADARRYGAALLGVQTKATIKQAETSEDGEPLVARTPDRAALWEAHTPQVVRCDLLRKGFENASANHLAVTDDVSLVELLGEPVKLTQGEYTNIKVTTPDDIAVAEAILRSRGVEEPPSR